MICRTMVEKSVFIFEYISCGGLIEEEIPTNLFMEGFAMLSSLIYDFADIGFKVNIMVDERINEHILKVKQEIPQLNFVLITNINEFKRNFDKYVIDSVNTLIIGPESENILFNLVRNAENIIRNYTEKKLLNPPSSFIYTFSDKLLAKIIFDKEQIKTPNCFSVAEFLKFYENKIDSKSASQEKLNPSENFIQEFIVKPVDGVDCINTYKIVFNNKDLFLSRECGLSKLKTVLAHIQKISPNQEFIVQKSVEGIPLSISAINNDGKLVFFSLNKQNIQFNEIQKYSKKDIRVFSLDYIGGQTPYYLEDRETRIYLRFITEKLCIKYPFIGFFGIDFMYTPVDKAILTPKQSIHVLEVNPRTTTPYIAYSEIFRKQGLNILDVFFKDLIYDEKILFQEIYEFNKNEENRGISLSLREKQDQL